MCCRRMKIISVRFVIPPLSRVPLPTNSKPNRLSTVWPYSYRDRLLFAYFDLSLQLTATPALLSANIITASFKLIVYMIMHRCYKYIHYDTS